MSWKKTSRSNRFGWWLHRKSIKKKISFTNRTVHFIDSLFIAFIVSQNFVYINFIENNNWKKKKMINKKIEEQNKQKWASTVSKRFNIVSFWEFILDIYFIFYREGGGTCQIIVVAKKKKIRKNKRKEKWNLPSNLNCSWALTQFRSIRAKNKKSKSEKNIMKRKINRTKSESALSFWLGSVIWTWTNLPLAFSRASSSTVCFVCLTIIVSKRASSTSERRRDGYPF